MYRRAFMGSMLPRPAQLTISQQARKAGNWPALACLLDTPKTMMSLAPPVPGCPR